MSNVTQAESRRRRRFTPEPHKGVSPFSVKAVYLELCRRVEASGSGTVQLDVQDWVAVLSTNRGTLWRALTWLESNGTIYRRGKSIGLVN